MAVRVTYLMRCLKDEQRVPVATFSILPVMVETSSCPHNIILLDKDDPQRSRELTEDEIAEFYVNSRRYANLVKEHRPDVIAKIKPDIIEQLDSGLSNVDWDSETDSNSV